MNELKITINGQPFDHLAYHFVLTYSNWETGKVCFSESFESLGDGFQSAVWELGAVPEWHRTDSLTAAVNQDCRRDVFTERYKGLMKHYDVKSERPQVGAGNENGDVEQRHYRFKSAVEQKLLLRGHRPKIL